MRAGPLFFWCRGRAAAMHPARKLTLCLMASRQRAENRAYSGEPSRSGHSPSSSWAASEVNVPLICRSIVLRSNRLWSQTWLCFGADLRLEIELGMRRSFAAAAYVLAASMAAIGAAQGAECPGNPNALGVSRTIVLDPVEHPRLGTLQYDESLPLNDHEVVLTFDDGPLQPYTNRVLDTLAAECVKATFFLVGRMAQGYPHLVQREYAEGHTIAGHSQNHPFTFAKMSVED